MRFVRVSLTAVKIGNRLVLLDALGQRLCKTTPNLAKRCGAKLARWMIWANRSLARLDDRTKRATRTEWDKRIDNWIIIDKLRRRDLKRPRRTRQGNRNTTEWKDAITRLWFEHHNAARRSDKWRTWADQTAKNQGRRFEASAIARQDRASVPA